MKCHQVPGYSRYEGGLPTLEAPSFGDMARQPDIYTDKRLRAFLQQPHWPMTQFRLSQRDIDNLLAFIKSLGAE